MSRQFDRWSREGMPSGEDMAAIQRGIDATMREVVANRNIPHSASMMPDRQRAAEEPPRAPSGGTVPIASPPGVNYVDALCDAADRRDRIAAIRAAQEAAWIESHFEKPPRIETDYEPFSAENMKK
jgi:hypothetical protein